MLGACGVPCVDKVCFVRLARRMSACPMWVYRRHVLSCVGACVLRDGAADGSDKVPAVYACARCRVRKSICRNREASNNRGGGLLAGYRLRPPESFHDYVFNMRLVSYLYVFSPSPDLTVTVNMVVHAHVCSGCNVLVHVMMSMGAIAHSRPCAFTPRHSS